MFITFEGIDGSGKSTQAKKLAEYFVREYKREVELTREPGGWRGGAELRRMAGGGSLKHKWSEAFLFMLDRSEHVARIIAPALKNNRIVLCDRYHDSTLAYQVWGRGLPLAIFDAVAALADFPVPNLSLFFDVPVETAMARASRRSKPDAFEKEGEAFMTKVRDGYRALVGREPDRWVVIDCGAEDTDTVFAKTLNALGERGFLDD